MNKLSPACKLALLISTAFFSSHSVSFAQTGPAPAAEPNPAAGDKIVELSPFIVSDKGKQGYGASQTMLGSRSAKDLVDIPMSIGIINLEMLQDLGATTVHDVLKYGVSGATQSQTFNEDTNIRGFRSINSTLRDGVPRLGGSNKYPPLYDIERVELIKGPAAMLTGTNTPIGGSLNYVSRVPTDNFAGDVQFTLTERGGYRYGVNATGPLFKSKDLRANYRVTIGGQDDDDPVGKPTEYKQDQFVGGGLTFYFGNRTSVTTHAYYYVDDSFIYPSDFLDLTAPVNTFTNLREARINPRSAANYAAGRRQDSFWYLTTVSGSVTALTKLTENSNLRMVYGYYWGDERRDNPRGITLNANNYTLTRQDTRTQLNTESHNFQVDYLHQLTLDWFNLSTTVGADGNVGRTGLQQVIGNMPTLDTQMAGYPGDDAWYAANPHTYDYFARYPSGTFGALTKSFTRDKSFSYYFYENLKFWKDRIILVGGLRWYKPSQQVANAANVTTDSALKHFRVHNYGAVFKVTPELSAYFVMAQNIFPPDTAIFTDKFVQGDRLGEPYKQSEGKLKEVGLKYDHVFSARLSMYANLALFQMEQNNLRTIGLLANGQLGNIQSGKDEAEGWETDIGLRAKAGPGNFDALLTYFDGNSAIAADKGKPYVQQTNDFVPTKSSLLVKYSWTDGPLKGLVLGVGTEREATKRNATYTVDRPQLYDAFAKYAFARHWEAQVNLENLTGERYIIKVYNSGLASVSDTFRSRLTVRYRY